MHRFASFTVRNNKGFLLFCFNKRLAKEAASKQEVVSVGSFPETKKNKQTNSKTKNRNWNFLAGFLCYLFFQFLGCSCLQPLFQFCCLVELLFWFLCKSFAKNTRQEVFALAIFLLDLCSFYHPAEIKEPVAWQYVALERSFNSLSNNEYSNLSRYADCFALQELFLGLLKAWSQPWFNLNRRGSSSF